MTITPEKLLLREKISYGFGNLASVLYWQTFMVYLSYFYTDVFLIPAAAAGTMILISRFWDGVVDPIMGMIADRTETRWGKFRPYLLWICVPLAIVGVLTFTTPDLGASGKLLWAYCTYNLLMMLYTAFNIPYLSMLGVISPDPNERTSVSSIAMLFAYGAGMIVSATLLPMAKALGGGTDARGWQLSFVIYGLAAVIFLLIAFAGTRERVRPPKAQRTSVGRDLRDLFTNGPWLILLPTTLTFILFVAVRSSVLVHYFKYFVGPQDLALPFLGRPGTFSFEVLVSAFNTTGQMMGIVGVLLLTPFTRLVGRKRAFISLFVVAVVSTAAFYFLKPNQLLLIFALNLLCSLTGGPLSVLLSVMYADAADYGEWKRGRRSTGLVFSASTMSQKFSWALGAYVALGLITQVGFQPNVEQTPAALHGLLLLVSLIPAAIGAVSIGLVLVYPLNEAKVAQIEADLKARRASDEAVASAG